MTDQHENQKKAKKVIIISGPSGKKTTHTINEDDNIEVVYLENSTSSAGRIFGILSLVFGVLSLFVLSFTCGIFALIFGVVGLIKRTYLLSTLGIIFAIIGVITSPIYLFTASVLSHSLSGF